VKVEFVDVKGERRVRKKKVKREGGGFPNSDSETPT